MDKRMTEVEFLKKMFENFTDTYVGFEKEDIVKMFVSSAKTLVENGRIEEKSLKIVLELYDLDDYLEPESKSLFDSLIQKANATKTTSISTLNKGVEKTLSSFNSKKGMTVSPKPTPTPTPTPTPSRPTPTSSPSTSRSSSSYSSSSDGCGRGGSSRGC